MKFYNEYDKKFYNTQEDCLAAETAFLKAKEEKENGEKAAVAELDAFNAKVNECTKKVNDANKALGEASRALQAALNKFAHTYGYVPDKYRSIQILSWLLP